MLAFRHCLLVTGASSGIGLALTRHYLSRGDVVVAVARCASHSSALADLSRAHPRLLVVMDCDIRSEASLATLATSLQQQSLAPVTLFNCAGMLHQPGLPSLPEKRLEQVSEEGLLASFSVNAFAPVLLARHLFPLMPTSEACAFASLSARVGSISDNQLGGWYSYRAAKAAQNQLLSTLAIEARRRWPHIRILMLHPGTTDTPLSKPFQRRVPEGKLFDPDWVATRLAGIVEKSDSNDSGRFIDWQGKDVGW